MKAGIICWYILPSNSYSFISLSWSHARKTIIYKYRGTRCYIGF